MHELVVVGVLISKTTRGCHSPALTWWHSRMMFRLQFAMLFLMRQVNLKLGLTKGSFSERFSQRGVARSYSMSTSRWRSTKAKKKKRRLVKKARFLPLNSRDTFPNISLVRSPSQQRRGHPILLLVTVFQTQIYLSCLITA